MKAFLSGNEAVARGAYEAGVRFAAAYPGTPSTEILENCAKYSEIASQWSTNEKVAMEVTIGASLGGARSLVAMKHVGLNVAADPFFTLSYTGVNGGVVVVSADDPGMHSSQNEQDNRHYAPFAKVPMLEPSDSQEAKDFVKVGMEISEAFDTPVLLRMTTRVCHSKSVVELGERAEPPKKTYQKDFAKYVVLPSNARKRHVFVEERTKKLEEYSESFPGNRIEPGEPELGVVTGSVAYQYAREVFPKATFLKLSMSYPLPRKLIREFAGKVKKIVVIEELDPYIEENLKAMGIPVEGKSKIPLCGELSTETVAKAFGEEIKPYALPVEVPIRFPVLCPGCPHSGIYYVLKTLKATVTGDIGCYTLGGMPPLSAMDTCICMGASVGMALGMEKAMGRDSAKRIVATIGDSTFLHSGITGLLDIVYNKGVSTVCILDNGTTAMTGHQDHPGTGKTLAKEPTSKVDYAALARSLGIKDVKVIDPYDLKAVREAFKDSLSRAEPSVVIAQRACVLLDRKGAKPPAVDLEKCNACGLCFLLGCPAMEKADGKPVINEVFCVGCHVCAEICNREALQAL